MSRKESAKDIHAVLMDKYPNVFREALCEELELEGTLILCSDLYDPSNCNSNKACIWDHSKNKCSSTDEFYGSIE